MAAKLITNSSWNKSKVLKSQRRQWEFMRYWIRKLTILIPCQQGKTNQIKLQVEVEVKTRGAFERSKRKCLEGGRKDVKYFYSSE